MNEKRMKTTVNAEEVSSPSAQTAGRGVQTDGERSGGSEKRCCGGKIWLDKSSDGMKIAETASETQFDAMNNKSNGKSRSECL